MATYSDYGYRTGRIAGGDFYGGAKGAASEYRRSSFEMAMPDPKTKTYSTSCPLVELPSRLAELGLISSINAEIMYDMMTARHATSETFRDVIRYLKEQVGIRNVNVERDYLSYNEYNYTIHCSVDIPVENTFRMPTAEKIEKSSEPTCNSIW